MDGAAQSSIVLRLVIQRDRVVSAPSRDRAGRGGHRPRLGCHDRVIRAARTERNPVG